jgi:hypothetical protein
MIDFQNEFSVEVDHNEFLIMLSNSESTVEFQKYIVERLS